jgi:hypothetical protein
MGGRILHGLRLACLRDPGFCTGVGGVGGAAMHAHGVDGRTSGAFPCRTRCRESFLVRGVMGKFNALVR